MTVTSTATKSGWLACNGTATVFAFSFKTITASQVAAVVRSVGGTAETALTAGTHYSVQGAGTSSGAIMLTTAGLLLAGAGKELQIRRVTPRKQETSMANQGAYFAKTHEKVFDYITMLVQEVEDSISALADRVSAVETGLFSQAQIEEIARDAVGAALRSGTNINITTDDAANTIRISNIPSPAVTAVTYIPASGQTQAQFAVTFANGLPNLIVVLRFRQGGAFVALAGNGVTTGFGTNTQYFNAGNVPVAAGTYTPTVSLDNGLEFSGTDFTIGGASGTTPAPPLVSIQTPLVGNAARLNFQLAESVPPVPTDFNPGVDSIQGQVALDNAFTTQLKDLTATPTLAEWNTGQTSMPFTAFTGIGTAYTVYFRGRVNRPNAASSNWSSTGSYLQDNLPAVKASLQSLITNFTPTIRVTPALGVTNANAVAGQTISITLNRAGGPSYTLTGTIQAGDITGGGTGFTTDVTSGAAIQSGSYTGTVSRGGGIEYAIAPFSLTTGINVIGEATTPSDFQGAGTQSFAFTGLTAGSASRHLVVGIHTWHFGAVFSAFKIVKNGVTTSLNASVNITQGNGTFILLHIPPTLTDANGSITATGTAFTIEMTGSDFFSSGLAEMFEVTNMAPPAIGDAVFVQGSGTTAYSIAASTPAGGASLAFFRKNFAGAQAGANPITWSGTGVIAAADASTTINEYRVAAAYRTQVSSAPFVATTATAGALDQAVVVTLNGG